MISEVFGPVQHAILTHDRLSDEKGARLRTQLTDPVELALLDAALHLARRDYEASLETVAPYLADREFVASHPLGPTMVIAQARGLFGQKNYADVRTNITDLVNDRTSFNEQEREAVSHLLGSACLEAEIYEEAYSHFTDALQLAERLRDQRLIGLIEFDLSNVAVATADYVKGMTWLQQSLLHFEEATGVESDVARARINLAVLYIRLGRLEDALSEYEDLTQNPVVMDDPQDAATTLLNFAITLKRLNHTERSLATYKLALESAERHGFTSLMIRAMIGIADHYKIQKNYREAQQWIDRARVVVEERNVTSLVSLVLAHAAHVQYLMGEVETAIEMMRQAYQQVLERDNPSDAMHYGLDLAEWLAEQGQSSDAYLIQRECYDLQQKINAKEFERSLELNELRTRLDQERQIIKSRDEERNRILHSMMPSNIAQRLMAGEQRIADRIPSATVMFADIVGFTALSSHTQAEDLVVLLEELFSKMDAVGQRHGCQRVKTIGDAYMAICGASEPLADHAQRVVRAAVEFLTLSLSTVEDVQLRIGINTGPVVAGVMRGARIAYDVWGDTVNVASRMEELSQPGRILVTAPVADAVRDMPGIALEQREPLDVHGKGLMETYWVRSSA